MNDPCDSVLERAQALVGQVLRDKWHLDSLIGVGGMASVFAATHRNGRRGAVKLLHTEFSLDKSIRSRFLREGYLANKVGHPGTVEILDDDTVESGAVFLVMELLEGETVDRRWVRKDRRLETGEVLLIADKVLDVLAAAHDKGIVHRDVKPENMFITHAGEIKVLDFGIARLRDLSQGSTATRFGTTLGTPAYMSPEQALGRNDEVDSISDLWAVGASMFTLLTGRHVHGGKTVNEQLVGAATKQAPLVRSIDPDVPPRVAAVVDKALAFERKDRWTDARAMQRAVREAYLELFGGTMATAPRLEVPDAGLPDLLEQMQTQPLDASSIVQTTMKPATASRRPTPPGPRFRRWPLWAVGGVSLATGIVIALTGWRALVRRHDPGPPQAALGAPTEVSAAAQPSADPVPAALSASAATAPLLDPGSILVTVEGGACNVTVDGTPRGPAPVSVSVTPGEHHVVCTNRDGLGQEKHVEVASRQEVRASFRLRKADPRAPAPAASASPTATVAPAPATATAPPPDPRDRRK